MKEITAVVRFRNFSVLLFIKLFLAFDAEVTKENDRTDFQVSKKPHGFMAGHSTPSLFCIFSTVLPSLSGYILIYVSTVTLSGGMEEETWASS